MLKPYTGHFKPQFIDFAIDAGGNFDFEVRNREGGVLTIGNFSYVDGELFLTCNQQSLECLTGIIRHLEEMGCGTFCDGTGSEGNGNVTNSVLGNRNIYAKCFYLDICFSDWLGKPYCPKNSPQPYGTNVPYIQHTSPKVPKQPKAPKAPKAPKISKADQRPMRPANGKAVWNDAYIKAKGIDYADFIAKHGKQQVYDDLGSMTVIEFETKYGLR